MKNKNTITISYLNDELCKIEAKCFPQKIFEGNNLNTNSYMLTSGSLNLSKTISNLSVQTIRLSKNSLITSGRECNGQNKLVSFDISDDKEINLSTNSIIFNKDKRSEHYIKGLNYTPSTICNYYEQSNEVTPCKFDKSSNTIINELKLDLDAIRINVSNEKEINLVKKTPIKYTKSQNNNHNSSRSNKSPKVTPSSLDKILSLNCKMNDACINRLTNEVRKDIIVHISELNIEDKILNADYKSPTANNVLEKAGLNFTFNKTNTDEREYEIISKDPILVPEPIKCLKAKNSKINSLNLNLKPKTVSCTDLQKNSQNSTKYAIDQIKIDTPKISSTKANLSTNCSNNSSSKKLLTKNNNSQKYIK
jgi:hypothetical protein